MNFIEKGKGQDLLFFHGIGVTPDSYVKTINMLAKEFHVVAPHVKAYRKTEENEKNITLLTQKLNMKDIVVVGHSAGGIAAYNFVLNNPKQIKASILIDPAGAGLKKPVSALFARCVRPALELMTQDNDSFARIVKDCVITMLDPIEAYRNAKFVSGYAFKQGKLPVPVLILHGKEDSLLPLISSEKIHKLIEGSKLEVVSGNHNWLMTKPELLLEKIKEFIR
jgi:pimeloyl-ACP methyl ester carboxylesterase